jgi:hypothetical protein
MERVILVRPDDKPQWLSTFFNFSKGYHHMETEYVKFLYLSGSMPGN